jgi:hypothetical protein
MSEPAHPLDAPLLARRLQVVRALCTAMIAGVVVVVLGVVSVLTFVFDWGPLAGHRVTVGGVSVLTPVAAVLTLATPAVAMAVGGSQTRAGVRKLAADPPAPPGREADAEGLVGVFAGATFAEYAVTAAVGFAWAVVLHATADPLMLVWVAGLLAFLAVRYPTDRRARGWFDRAAELLARERADLPD